MEEEEGGVKGYWDFNLQEDRKNGWNQFFRTPTGPSNVLNTQQHLVQYVLSKRNHPLPRSRDQNLRVTLRSSPCHMILP